MSKLIFGLRVALTVMFLSRFIWFMTLTLHKDPEGYFMEQADRSRRLFQNTASSRFTSLLTALIWLSAIWVLNGF